MGIIIILRVTASFVIGLILSEYYDSKNINSHYHISKKPYLYHKRKYFLIWCIPFYGWMWYLYISIKRTSIKIFNE
jgi:hypothetical protein